MERGGMGRTSGKVAKGIGCLTMILGCAWAVMALWPWVRVLTGEKELEHAWFMFGMVPLLAVPGALAILAGYCFFREVTLSNLKVVVGLYSAFVALEVSSRFSDRFPDIWHQKATHVFVLDIAVFAILIYLLALRWLVPVTGMKWNGYRRMLNKGVFLLLSWLLWQALFNVGMEVFPITGGGPWNDLIVLFGPLIIVVVLYKLAVKWLKADQQSPNDPPP